MLFESKYNEGSGQLNSPDECLNPRRRIKRCLNRTEHNGIAAMSFNRVPCEPVGLETSVVPGSSLVRTEEGVCWHAGDDAPS